MKGDKYHLPHYEEIDKLALKVLNESGLKLTKPAAIEFARMLLLEVRQLPMPEMYDVLKGLGVRKERRKHKL